MRALLPIPLRSGLVLALALPLAGQTASLSLRPGAEVTGEGVFLEQLLALSDTAKLPHLRVADPPTVGQALVLTRAQVGALLDKAAPELATTNWSGPKEVRVTRRARPLAETELKELLTDAIQRDHVRQRGELELAFTRPWTPVMVADEPLTLRILDLPASGISPNMIVRFELRGAKETFGPWSAVTQARVWREILVAVAPLNRGQPLAEGDVRPERRDLLLARDALDTLPRVETGLELVEGIPAGVALTPRAFKIRPLIQRGQTLDALITDGALQISTKVEVLEDGLPGQFVRVRNPQSRREFRGKVHNENTILVQL